MRGRSRGRAGRTAADDPLPGIALEGARRARELSAPVRRLDSMSEPRATLGGVLGKDYEGQECALAAALEVLGERWTLLIVRDAFFGVRRYSDWVARLDIPRAVLAERLRGLVDHGILVK